MTRVRAAALQLPVEQDAVDERTEVVVTQAYTFGSPSLGRTHVNDCFIGTCLAPDVP